MKHECGVESLTTLGENELKMSIDSCIIFCFVFIFCKNVYLDGWLDAPRTSPIRQLE